VETLRQNIPDPVLVEVIRHQADGKAGHLKGSSKYVELWNQVQGKLLLILPGFTGIQESVFTGSVDWVGSAAVCVP
jgi:hypothetical protein